MTIPRSISVDVQEVSVYTRDSREFWTRQQQFNERTTSQLAQSDRQLAQLKAVIALMCNKIKPPLQLRLTCTAAWVIFVK